MKKIFFTVLIFSVLLLCACGTDMKGEKVIYTFTDSLGREVKVISYDKTAVISGSLAEIWQLAGGELYGVTSDAFERDVIELSEGVKDYGGTHNPSIERLIADGVDFVILSGTAAGQVKLSTLLEYAGITAAYFEVESFEDYLDTLKIFTDITGRSDLYIQNGENIRAELEQTKITAQEHDSPDILLLRAVSTGMKARNSDNMTGSMLADLGCVNIADSDSSLLEALSLEAVIRSDPDCIFITTMGDEATGFAQYEAELASNPAWQQLSAVKNGRVYILPKELYHYKPNVRWAQAYKNLAQMLYEK